MKKVLIPTKLDAVAGRILTEHGGYQVVQDDASGLPALAEAHPDAYALIVRSEKVPGEVMALLPALKVIIRAGAGYNTIDVKEARRRGIDVMNTPGANANAVAEEVVAMMLADARHLVQADASVREGKWEKKQFMGREISGKTLGVVGVGFIGRMLIKRVQGFDMRIIGYDPVLTEDRARDLGLELADLRTVFETADYVSLHVPENDQTRGMVNADLLGRMKPNATIINCARAGILDEEAFRQAKAERGLRLLNDVYPKDEEGTKPIAGIANLVAPHLGANTEEANRNAACRAAEQLIEFDDRGITSYIVNREIPAGLDEAYGELANAVAGLCRCMVGRDARLQSIASSFYGSLAPYAQWLILPMLSGALEDFSRTNDYASALQYLKDMGVDYEDRETDLRKGFENSITIDMRAAVDATRTRTSSVRGTVAESHVMISRIDDFDKLYFEPFGHNLIVTYRDRPGILGLIGAALAEAGINIDDVRNPHDSKGVNSLAWLKVNQPVPPGVVAAIAAQVEAETAVYAEI
jgi:D-3-phosphoglycerate dehydrogenase / 2-oxoglutarate reductase